MGIIGCNVDGYMDDDKFSKPMPWIGIYIAAASLACLIAVTADLVLGFRGRKLWFPCKYFCLNATTLTLIGVALKLSVDLNTSMPQRSDQLAKLTSSAFTCTIMGNSMPSLGVTDKKETMMNVVAMGILVITMIANICIQFGTGVIYVFWAEHVVIILLMLILLMTMFSLDIAIPKMKHYLELKYETNEAMLKESLSRMEEEDTGQLINNLRDELMRVWMMAHTSSPQFVLGRSVTCTASGAFCLLSTLALAEAMLRSYLMPWSLRFCSGDSDYKWSTTLILIVQVAAVAVGTIAPAFRWFTAITYRWPNVRHKNSKRRLQVEGYWIDRLELMKERPLGYRIQNRQFRKIAHDAKLLLLNLFIKMQVGIVLLSKATQFISISLMCLVLECYQRCKRLKSNFNNNVSSISSVAESKPDLKRFVLHLEGEEELVEVMMKNNRDATNHWFHVGEKNEPKQVIELIQDKCSVLQGFKGVATFDSDQVLSLHPVEALYGWSLPLVTLASIIVAIPNINRLKVKNLIGALNEGLLYVKFIENNMDKEGKLSKLRMAADIVWLGVDLYDKWLDVDLYKLSLQGKSPKETIERLAEAAKIRYDKFKAKYRHICNRVAPSSWPIKILASNSMYRISQTSLLNNEIMSSERLFEALTEMICDILGACLTNLPHVISTKCLNSAIEEREESVRYAVCMLGQTHRIIEMLEKRTFPSLDFSKGTNIEDWRLMHKIEALDID
ncbi:uncharacterized protein LOC130939720 isoform X1 [Arachis stenosperma]|uniref:uncharacterized protein LOC130939720 isoform X1 n=1 Tax=Arachis stenosperma TaxID=217475 RepID=UPI0025ABB3F1|nr:uncharacterized protein LOC130939720 isoform X1 [Arachis stenosperma]